MKKDQRIFVYGTLKQKQYFHDRYLGGEKSNFLGDAIASPDYSLYIDGLPHMIKEPSDTGVKGELYEVDAVVLAELDALEGHPEIYHREIIEITDKDGEKKLAWAYLRSQNFKGKICAFKEFEFI